VSRQKNVKKKNFAFGLQEKIESEMIKTLGFCVAIFLPQRAQRGGGRRGRREEAAQGAQ
jgi:hypothetical protein